MGAYVSMSKKERREMLAEVGMDLDQLFDVIPQELRFDLAKLEHLDLEGMSEFSVAKKIKALAAKNITSLDYKSYLGAGSYEHYRPVAINHLINRQEFLTSYTPYQAEVSQGTLQTIFEWQSYICRLTKLDVANASMYDGPSAAAEAVLMACRQNRRYHVLVGGTVNPQTKAVVKTYCHAAGIKYEETSVSKDGMALFDTAGDYGAVLAQSPNFYGIVEDLKQVSDFAHSNKALAVSSMDPISLALLKAPGDLGIDIAVGEAHVLGNPMNFGGPALAYLACRSKFLRKMPGRIVGETKDRDQKTAYVLTVQAREQHIRREKATSNICTSQALLATAATIYMALNGRSGLLDVASQTANKSLYLAERLCELPEFKLVYDSAFFREFLLETKLDLKALNSFLLEKKIMGGLIVEENKYLLAVTETKSKADLDEFVAAVKEFIGGQA